MTTHYIFPSGLTTAAPAIDSPVAASLYVPGFTVGAIDFDAPAINQTHKIRITTQECAHPVLTAASLGQNHTLLASDLVPAQPVINDGVFVIDALAVDLTIAPPVLGSPTTIELSKWAVDLVDNTPVIDAATIGQLHNLTASNFTPSGHVAFEWRQWPPFNSYTTLLAVDLAVASPVINAGLLADRLVAAPWQRVEDLDFDAAILGQLHGFVGADIATGVPEISAGSLSVHNLVAVNLEIEERPVLNPAAIVEQNYHFVTPGIEVVGIELSTWLNPAPPPLFLVNAFRQRHDLIVTPLLEVGAPEIGIGDTTEILHYAPGPYYDQFGQQILYRNATGLEKAMADVDAERLMEINAELIIDTWDPYLTFERNLPFLAWAYNIDLWEDGWSESTKREWTALAFEFKKLRGTITAHEVALDYAGRDFTDGITGYRIVQYLTPPQGFYASPDLTVEEFNGWIRLMPQIRIYLGNDPGSAYGYEFFTDDGAADVNAAAYDDGWELYGRKAILRQQGYDDVNLTIIQRELVTSTYTAIDYEEIRVPGKSEIGYFVGEDAVGEARFVNWDDVAPQLYNVRLNRSFDDLRTELHLSSISPSLEPIDVTYERNSDIGDAGPFIFADDGAADIDYSEEDYGALMLADYIYLLDPNINAVMNEGVSFADVDRVDFPKYTIEMLIDLRTREDAPVWYCDDSFVDESYASDTDLTHIDRAIRAVRAAKSLRDRVLVAFDPLRPVEPGDFLSEETTAEDWVLNQL